MSHHYHVSASVDTAFESKIFVLSELIESLIRSGSTIVGVLSGVAVTGEVLESRVDSAFAESLDSRCHQLCSFSKIVAVGSLSDDCVIRI